MVNPEKTIEKLDEVKAALRNKCGEFPRIVMVLGSGLGELAGDLEVEADIPYGDIPHFPRASVAGHRGRLVVGRLEGVRIAVMQGRVHYYEGHPMHEVVFPVRALGWAGAEAFILTNAAGGVHMDMAPLDIVLIRDHINLMGTNPLLGPNIEALGPRFPDLTHQYDARLREIVRRVASELKIPMREGVYVGIHGPSYETPSEILMYRKLGGDVVGMSTVPEAIALRHMGKRVLGLSCITNLAAGVTTEPLNHEEVLENAHKIYQRFSRLMKGAIRALGEEVG